MSPISSLTILVDSCSQIRTLLSKICESVVAASSAAIIVGITLTSQNASTSLRCRLQLERAKGRALARESLVIMLRLLQLAYRSSHGRAGTVRSDKQFRHAQ